MILIAWIISKSYKSIKTTLRKLSNNKLDIAEKIIKQSIESGWAGFYPLKDFNQTQTNKQPLKITYTAPPGRTYRQDGVL